MARIKPPFPYFGSKGRFYKKIKEIFEKNYRPNFIDLFAGAMEIPLSFKNEFDSLKVLANVKDEKIECLLKANALEVYKKGLEYIKHDLSINARDLYDKDKEKFQEENKIFKNIFSECCPCCGKKLSTRKKHEVFNENEKIILKSLMGFGGCNASLSSAFYSPQRLENLESYIKALKSIKITNNLFDENWKFKDSFIFLDPPYIQKTVKKDKKFIGYNYTTNKGIDWTIDDDERLIQFIRNNQNKNNVFLVFGSIDNNLSKLLKDNFTCEFIEKEYKHSTFGKVTIRSEYFCLIK
nr:MAG TPA: D12 class N6 adenine-specific DNA methyltransferase [Caudoviricetes sp.]